MSEKEKRLSESMAKAAEVMNTESQIFMIGFAEGVAAMGKKQEADDEEKETA